MDDGLLERYLRRGRRDTHRFLLLCLSVPDGHCASSARSCLAPKGLFLLSTLWTSVDFVSLSLRSLKVRPSKMPLQPQKTSQTQQHQTQQTNPQKQTNRPHPKIAKFKQAFTLNKSNHTNLNNPTRNLKDENGEGFKAYR